MRTASPPKINNVQYNSTSGLNWNVSIIHTASTAHTSPHRNPAAILNASERLFPFATYKPAQMRATAPVVTPIYVLNTAQIGGINAIPKANVPIRIRFSFFASINYSQSNPSHTFLPV